MDEKTAPVPERLYHYTSAEGFLGICESAADGLCNLQATQYRFLSDAKEIGYAIKVVREVAEHMGEEFGESVVAKAVQAILNIGHESTCILSFSENHESLSQWRAYADNGKGFCLGFDLSGEEYPKYGSGVPDDEGDCARYAELLLKCRYEDCRGERVTKAFVDACRRDRKRRSSAWPMSDVDILVKAAWEEVLALKNPKFRDEDEWRIMAYERPFFPKFRSRDGMMIPYTTVPGLALQEVWVGPNAGPTQDAAKQSAKWLLKRHGLDAAVQVSESPMR